MKGAFPLQSLSVSSWWLPAVSQRGYVCLACMHPPSLRLLEAIALSHCRTIRAGMSIALHESKRRVSAMKERRSLPPLRQPITILK